MVILALLVAVYLPMTLVTGIFEMNIVEITRTENAPSRWTAVKAWGVVSGASVGCVLVYVIGRLLLKQKERLRSSGATGLSDLEDGLRRSGQKHKVTCQSVAEQNVAG
jgi:membrane associated rhomboid family serine protease